MEDYMLDFHRLVSKNDLNESNEQMIARYVGGLKFFIQEKILLHAILTLDDVVNMADQIEKSTSKSSRFASTSAGQEVEKHHNNWNSFIFAEAINSYH